MAEAEAAYDFTELIPLHLVTTVKAIKLGGLAQSDGSLLVVAKSHFHSCRG